MNYLFIMYCIMFSPFFTKALKPNLCINCKFYKRNFLSGNKFGKCLLFPREVSNDYIFVDGTNSKKKEYYYCSTARTTHHMCGEEGLFFNKK